MPGASSSAIERSDELGWTETRRLAGGDGRLPPGGAERTAYEAKSSGPARQRSENVSYGLEHAKVNSVLQQGEHWSTRPYATSEPRRSGHEQPVPTAENEEGEKVGPWSGRRRARYRPDVRKIPPAFRPGEGEAALKGGIEYWHGGPKEQMTGDKGALSEYLESGVQEIDNSRRLQQKRRALGDKLVRTWDFWNTDARNNAPFQDPLPAVALTLDADALAVRKYIYLEHEDVNVRCAEQTEIWRRQHDVDVKVAGEASEAANPVLNWTEAMLPEYLSSHIEKRLFDKPTPIQGQALPIAFSERDMLATSPMGTGKTLCYVIPACLHVDAQDPTAAAQGPSVLVLVPTRELAMQVCGEFKAAGGGRIKAATVHGGVTHPQQCLDVGESACTVLVATPGRLLDLVRTGDVKLTNVTLFIVDEAEHMLSKDFEVEMTEIVPRLHVYRQTLLFSSTPSEKWPKGAITRVPDGAVRVAVRPAEYGHDRPAFPNVKQEFVLYHSYTEKVNELIHIFRAPLARGKTFLVFCNTRDQVYDLAEALRTIMGYEVLGLHGKMRQEERDFVLGEFRRGNTPILVATDLARCGLDLSLVHIVVNFCAPADLDTYKRRLGQTGRGDQLGVAHTFLCWTSVAQAKIGQQIIETMLGAPEDLPQRLKAFLQNCIRLQNSERVRFTGDDTTTVETGPLVRKRPIRQACLELSARARRTVDQPGRTRRFGRA